MNLLYQRIGGYGGISKLEIIFPYDHEKSVSEAMEQVLVHAGGAN